MLPVLDPIPKGIANALGSVALASLGLYFFFQAIPAASPELLLASAAIGHANLSDREPPIDRAQAREVSAEVQERYERTHGRPF